jgi:hypothetical protein
MVKKHLGKYRQVSWFGNGLQVGWPGFDSWQGQEIYLLATASRLAVGLAQPHILLGSLYPGVKLTTHTHVMLRSRMMELYLHFPIHLHGVVLN